MDIPDGNDLAPEEGVTPTKPSGLGAEDDAGALAADSEGPSLNVGFDPETVPPDTLCLPDAGANKGENERPAPADDGTAPSVGEPYRNDLPLKNKVEAVLFVTPDPLSLKKLAGIVGDVTTTEVKEAIAALQEEYKDRGVELVEIAGGYRFFTREEYAPWARKVLPEVSPSRLSRAALEALSIIAYQQPVTKVTVEEIRGCNCDGVIRTLLERKLIVADGQADMPGRPYLYKTTKHFLEYFGLSDLSELPPLKDATTEP